MQIKELDSLPQLNIGIFTDSYKPYISGVVRSIETFRQDLERLGHNTFIFAPDYPEAETENNVYRYLSLPAPTQPDYFFPIPLSFRLSFTVKRLHLNIIHVHTPFLMGLLGAVMARRFNIPLLFTYHTLYHNYTHYIPVGRSISDNMVKKWNKKFCNRCDLVIAPSLFVKDLVLESEVNRPVHVIPTGINLDDYQGNDRNWLKRKYGITPGEKVILHVGRLAREKSVDFILDAVEMLLSKKCPPFKLIIVGTGPEQENLKSLCRQKGINEYVVFTGRVSHNELLNCYAGGDVFVFASRSETQGIVLVEAKASGLPVVALHAPCMDGVITDGLDGFLVDDRSSFAEKVAYLLSNKNRAQKMGYTGSKRSTAFSAPLLAKKLEKTYYYVLQQKSKHLCKKNKTGSFK